MTALLLLVGPLVCYTADDAVRLEKEAFAYRDRIQSGHVELRSVMDKTVSGETKPRKLNRRQVWYLDNGRMRADREDYYLRKPTQPGADRYWTRRSLTDAMHLYCTEDESGGMMPYGAMVKHPDRVKEPLDAGVTDLRLLGMVPRSSFNLKQSSLRSQLDRPDVDVTEVKDETYEGVPCVKISFRRRSGTEGTLWIAPDRGPSLIGISVRGETVEQQMRSRIEKHPASGLWFPTQCRFIRREDGKVDTVETLAVKVHSLNQPLPPETFTFAGMGLPNGSEVASVGLGQPKGLFWTGAELLPAYHVEPGGGASPWWLWLAGVSAVLIGLVLVVRSLARR